MDITIKLAGGNNGMARIMLVIGNCETRYFDKIKVSVLERLTRAEETGILFCRAEDLGTEDEIMDAMNNLLANADPDVQLDMRHAEVAVVFDGDETASDGLMRILSVLEGLRERIGVWHFTYHLIWLAEEFPRLKYTYSELLKHFTGKKPAIKHIYFLSDRHSNLGHGKDIRLNGVSLLLSTLQGTNHIDPGFYTIGVGKNRITASEMRDYAKHQAVQALRSQLFHWQSFTSLEDICASSFDDEVLNANGLFHWLLKQINNRMTSTFAYAKGDTVTHTQCEALFDLDFTEMLNKWTKNMVLYLYRIPFHEKMIDFLKEDGQFHEMINSVEREFFGYRAPEIKPGLLTSSEKKNVIREYNTFRAMNQEETRKGWGELKKQWINCSFRILEEAKRLKRQRDDILDQYLRDDQFLQLCEEIAGETTRQIKQRLVRLEITSERFMSFSNNEQFTEEKADRMINWIAEETCKSVTQEDVIRDLAEIDYGQLVTQVYNPVISKSKVFLACPSRENFNDADETYLHIPIRLYREHITLQKTHIIPANSYEYQNVEALSLLKLNSDDDLKEGAGKLTAFQGRAELRETLQGKQKSNPEPVNSLPNNQTTDTPTPETKTIEENNPWGIRVEQLGDRYKVTFAWEDSIELITLRVDNEEGYCKTLQLKRKAFLNQGVDITELVDYGKNTISLVFDNRVLSSTVFPGYKKNIEIEVEQSEYMLNRETVLQKIIMKVNSVDGDMKKQLPESVIVGMRILLDQKDLLEMPLPWDKHKKQGWTIFLENDKDYMPVFTEEYASKYEIHII